MWLWDGCSVDLSNGRVWQPRPPSLQQGSCHATVSATHTHTHPSRHPNLLAFSPPGLATKLSALEAAFALPHPRAVLLVVEQPALLTMSERRIKVRRKKKKKERDCLDGWDGGSVGCSP
jgi:hypothetical protein